MDSYLADSVFIPGPNLSVVVWPNLFQEFIFNLTLGNLKAGKAKSRCSINDVLGLLEGYMEKLD